MTEQPTSPTGACPTWCRNRAEADAARSEGQNVDGVHAHVSEDVVVGESADPMTVRMIQLAGSDLVRIVLGQHVIDTAQAQHVAHALLRLTAAAELAEPGLGFVEVLLERSGVGTGELALAAGLDVDRVRAQRTGAQVLSVAELDRLALAAAQLVPLRAVTRWDQAASVDTDTGTVADLAAVEPVDAEPVESEVDRDDASELSAVADMNELAALADGPEDA